jgi:hypothetical protein
MIIEKQHLLRIKNREAVAYFTPTAFFLYPAALLAIKISALRASYHPVMSEFDALCLFRKEKNDTYLVK